MAAPSSATARCRRTRRLVRAVALGAVLVAACALVPAAAAADQAVRLVSGLEKQKAIASFRVPDDWTIEQRAMGVTLTAPSSRPGCSHLITAELNALYVSPTTTSVAWVRARLEGKGALIAASVPGDLSWGVALKSGARASDGSAARLTGKGRYGPIMTEVTFTATLAGSCASNQSLKAAKRLSRLLPSLTLTAVSRR